MKATVLISTSFSGKYLIVNLINFGPELMEQLNSYLSSQRLSGLLFGNFADLKKHNIGFESRTKSIQQTKALQRAIEQFCHFGRISHGVRPLNDGRISDVEITVAKADW